VFYFYEGNSRINLDLQLAPRTQRINFQDGALMVWGLEINSHFWGLH